MCCVGCVYCVLCFICTHTLLTFWLHFVLDTGEGGCDKKSKLCGVRVQGVYPTLTVVDVQGEGTAAGYSKSRMWAMLSVDRLVHGWNNQ